MTVPLLNPSGKGVRAAVDSFEGLKPSVLAFSINCWMIVRAAVDSFEGLKRTTSQIHNTS